MRKRYVLREYQRRHIEEKRKRRANERAERLGWRTKQKRGGFFTSAKVTTSVHPTRSREQECLMCSGIGHMACQCPRWKTLTNELKEKEMKEDELRENEM